MKENSRIIWDYIVANDGKDFTCNDIAEAVSLNLEEGKDPKKSVNAIVTSFQRKGLTVRVEAEAEMADGTHQKIKLVQLTDAGKAFDPDAVVEAK